MLHPDCASQFSARCISSAPIPRPSYSGNRAITSNSPVLRSAIQKPTTSPVGVSHSQPLVEPASQVATLSGVMPRTRSSSIVSAFSRVRGLTWNRAGMSAVVISRMFTCARASQLLLPPSRRCRRLRASCHKESRSRGSACLSTRHTSSRGHSPSSAWHCFWRVSLERRVSPLFEY
jgi:hypothetical protein